MKFLAITLLLISFILPILFFVSIPFFFYVFKNSKKIKSKNQSTKIGSKLNQLSLEKIKPYTKYFPFQSGGIQEVKGELSYQYELGIVAGDKTEEGTEYKTANAILEREFDNKYDKNAVKVTIEGLTVGYIPKTQNKIYHKLLIRLEEKNIIPYVRANFTGGWDRGMFNKGNIGITLDIEQPPKLHNFEYSLLPEYKVKVSKEKNFQKELEEIIENNEYIDKVALLMIDNNKVMVKINDKIIGELSTISAKKYIPLIIEVKNDGLEPTCKARIYKKNIIEVNLNLPYV